MANFIILDVGENQDMSVVLQISFLATRRTLIDFEKCTIILRMEDNHQSFTMNTPSKEFTYLKECKIVDHKKSDDYGVIISRKRLVVGAVND